MKLCTPTLTEQDLSILATGLDALVKAQGLAVVAQVAAVVAKLDASVSDMPDGQPPPTVTDDLPMVYREDAE